MRAEASSKQLFTGLRAKVVVSRLRAELLKFGELLSLEMAADGIAHVQFETHAAAEAVVASLGAHKWKGPGDGAALRYNARDYDGDGARGWCIFEQGIARVACAHLEAAERKLARRQDGALPRRFALAQQSRAKLFDISPVRVSDDPAWSAAGKSPDELLHEAVGQIEKARFVGKGDKQAVQLMLASFEWVMKEAVVSTIEKQLDGFVQVDPRLLRNRQVAPPDSLEA